MFAQRERQGKPSGAQLAVEKGSPIRTATLSSWFNGGVETGSWESRFG
jgi:hypothetical protein